MVVLLFVPYATLWLLTARLFSYFILGPVIQSIVSLTSSLGVKMLTVLVSTISNSVIFAEKMCYSLFFSKNISLYVIISDQSFNDTLTNDIVSFEQLGPDRFVLLEDPVWH